MARKRCRGLAPLLDSDSPGRRVDAFLQFHPDCCEYKLSFQDVTELMLRIDSGHVDLERIEQLLSNLEPFRDEYYVQALLNNPTRNLIEIFRKTPLLVWLEKRPLFRLLTGDWQGFLSDERSLPMLPAHAQVAGGQFRELVLQAASAMPADRAKERCAIHFAIKDDRGLLGAPAELVPVLIDYLDGTQAQSDWAFGVLVRLMRSESQTVVVRRLLSTNDARLLEICRRGLFNFTGTPKEEALYLLKISRVDFESMKSWKDVCEILMRVQADVLLEWLKFLCGTDWMPVEGDRQTYLEIRRRVREGIECDPKTIQQALPVVRVLASIKVQGKITDIAFSPDAKSVAVATGSRRVVTWNFEDGCVAKKFGKFDRAVSVVAYCGETLLAAESKVGQGDDVYLYGCYDDAQIFLKNCEDSLVALSCFDDEFVLTATKSGGINTARLIRGHGHLVLDSQASFYADGGVRHVSMDNGNNNLLVFHKRISELSLPSLVPVKNFAGGGGVACGTFATGAGGYLLGTVNGDVFFADGDASGSRHNQLQPKDRRPQAHLNGAVLSILPLTDGFCCVSTSGDIILLNDWGELIGQSRLGFSQERKVTSVKISIDENLMVLGHADGTVSLCEIYVRKLCHLLSDSLDDLDPADGQLFLHGANALFNSPPTRNSLLVIHKLLDEKFSLDVEIESDSPIKPGAFDIEIED